MSLRGGARAQLSVVGCRLTDVDVECEDGLLSFLDGMIDLSESQQLVVGDANIDFWIVEESRQRAANSQHEQAGQSEEEDQVSADEV
jgi:hypothetical protein